MKPWIRLVETFRIFLMRSNAQTRMALFFCTALLVIGIALLVQNANLFSSRMEYLLDGQDFSTEQLDQFEFAFSKAGLRGYERASNRMRVPTASRDLYLKALSQAKCLPTKATLDPQLEPSSLQILEPRALSERRDRLYRIKRVEDTLSEFPFVRQAIVTYDEKTDGFAAERKRSATVSIQPRSHAELTRSQKGSVIRLVLKSFPGLKASDIVLVDLKRGETYADPSLEFESTADVASSGQEWKWVELKKHYEEDLQRKALALLSGYGEIKVVASSEWKSESATGSTVPADSSASGGNDVASGNQPATAPSMIANRKAKLGSRSVASESPATRLVPTAATLAVSIPTSYFQKVYLQQWQWEHPGLAVASAPAMTGASLQKLREETNRSVREKLAPLLSISSSAGDIAQRIVVSEHIDAAVSTGFSSTDLKELATKSLHWLEDSWGTLAILGLVVMAMFMLRSLALQRPRHASGAGSHLGQRAQGAGSDWLSRVEEPMDRFEPSVRQSDSSAGLDSKGDLVETSESIDKVGEVLSIPEVLAKDRLGAMAKRDPEKLAARLSAWISSN